MESDHLEDLDADVGIIIEGILKKSVGGLEFAECSQFLSSCTHSSIRHIYVSTDCKHRIKNSIHCSLYVIINAPNEPNNTFRGTMFVVITLRCHAWLNRANSLAFPTLIFVLAGPSGRAI
jgi:hypothetical protein